jgi:hypothetical protein
MIDADSTGKGRRGGRDLVGSGLLGEGGGFRWAAMGGSILYRIWAYERHAATWSARDRHPTYAEDDDENEEGVGHGEDGGGDRRDHLAQLLDAAEEPDDPQGPHQPHQPGRDGSEQHVHHRHGHDEQVQPVLPVRASERATLFSCKTL